jgi:hypothetical protein
VSDCCSTPSEKYFSHIMARTNSNFDEMMMMSDLYKYTIVEFYSKLTETTGADRARLTGNQSLLLLLHAACLEKKQQIPILVFYFVR